MMPCILLILKAGDVWCLEPQSPQDPNIRHSHHAHMLIWLLMSTALNSLSFHRPSVPPESPETVLDVKDLVTPACSTWISKRHAYCFAQSVEARSESGEANFSWDRTWKTVGRVPYYYDQVPFAPTPGLPSRCLPHRKLSERLPDLLRSSGRALKLPLSWPGTASGLHRRPSRSPPRNSPGPLPSARSIEPSQLHVNETMMSDLFSYGKTVYAYVLN